jgi:hypothetical protein
VMYRVAVFVEGGCIILCCCPAGQQRLLGACCLVKKSTSGLVWLWKCDRKHPALCLSYVVGSLCSRCRALYTTCTMCCDSSAALLRVLAALTVVHRILQQKLVTVICARGQCCLDGIASVWQTEPFVTVLDSYHSMMLCELH